MDDGLEFDLSLALGQAAVMKTHPAKRILAISSQTVFGPVGNSVIAPTLQSLGHEVLQLPTTILSNHPGHGKPEGQVLDSEVMQQMLAALRRLGALQTCDAIITGYFASGPQVAVVAQAIAEMRHQNPNMLILVDPVIGDNGALYVKPEVAEAIKQLLLPLATITTPNAYELSWLCGKSVVDEATAMAAAAILEVAEVIVTSVAAPPTQLSTILLSKHPTTTHHMDKLANIPNGTGDLLAALYIGYRLQHASVAAFELTMLRLETLVEKSRGSNTLLLY